MEEEKSKKFEFKDKGKKKYWYITDEKVKKIEESKNNRQNVLRKYGGKLPESIIKADFTHRQIDPFIKLDGLASIMQSTPELGPSDKGSKKSISRFPWNVGEIFLKIYTKKDDWVLDPFMGHNSRMQLVYENQRNYHGIDLSKKYMEHNQAVKKILLEQKRLTIEKNEIILTEADSRYVDLKENFYDFCLTSPPYWRQEHYGDEKGQLEFCKTYQAFLDELFPIIQRTYKALKSGSFCVWCINDFRDKQAKIFCIFHYDLITLFQKAGFEIFDIAIIDLGRSIRSCFANQFEKEKYLPKRHEYAIIAKKPDISKP